ncbi:MAG: serine hydrolase [Cyclobacteriaceae bacterium]|nr:serine hydrolase [Cyclobacteriaceae bacterium]
MKPRNLTLLLLLGGYLLSPVVFGQSTRYHDFASAADQYFNEAVNKLGIPGLAVTVVQNDKTILARGYGYADIENKRTASGSTSYYIASATKPFTALLTALLDDAGIIPLDDPLLKYFPGLKTESNLDLAKIKIRDLFTHTSGIDNDPLGWRVAYSGEHDHQTLLELMKYCVSNKAGYGKYEYTNVGYNIYSIILEKATGKPWQTWMQEKIFDPAGMKHTTALISKAEAESWLLAKPYMVTISTHEIQLRKKDNTMHAAGGIISTPEDMATWLKLQLGNGRLNGKQIIPEKIMIACRQKLVEMPEAKRIFQPSHYGMGWMFGTYDTEEVMHHFGSFAGFSAHTSFLPGKQIGLAILINEGLVGSELMNMIAAFTYDYFLKGHESVSVHHEQLDKFVSQVKVMRSRVATGTEQLNNRPWTLSNDFTYYSGQYVSEKYGAISVKGSTRGLNVTMGNMQCEATPYTNEESIRVELIPGRGQVIQFVTENKKPVKLKFNETDFEKID